MTFLLQSPAEIDVVAGFPILDVEAADRGKSPAVKGHVTTWDVTRDRVGEEHVTGPGQGRGGPGPAPVWRGPR